MDNYYNFENRDMRCANDVSRMAALGRFEKELISYGYAFFKENKIYYRICTDEEKIQKHFFNEILNDSYPSLINSYSYRTLIPAGMELELLEESKMFLAQEFKNWYSQNFFDELATFTSLPHNDSAMDTFTTWWNNIKNNFNLMQLQLFQKTVENSYCTKKISKPSLLYFKNNIKNIIHQFDDDPVIEKKFTRIFYGFKSWSLNGTVTIYLNAHYSTIFNRYLSSILKGNITGPILQKQYTFNNFSDLDDIRKEFKNILETYQNQEYYNILVSLNELPNPFNRQKFEHFIEEQHNTQCQQTLLYYGHQWHII